MTYPHSRVWVVKLRFASVLA